MQSAKLPKAIGLVQAKARKQEWNMADESAKDAQSRITTPATNEVPTVRWDDGQMASTYANVVNAASTREEVTLFFGTNRTWNTTQGEPVVVNLTNRIILNPHAAKRLLVLLTAVLTEYEQRFSKIVIGARPDMPPEV
jgi:hypothetical protein